MKEFNKGFITWVSLIACLTGLFLRIASYSWNNALNGDVNLFALTAREFAVNGRLDYPMKYEFSDQVPYLTLHTPASQHPPLWPLLSGIAAKLTSNDDTFSIQKLLCEIAGILLIGATALVARKTIPDQEPSHIAVTPIMLIAGSLVSLSAVLIDFSANGSPYILMALWVILCSQFMLMFNPLKVGHLITAGFLCVAGFLTHSALMFLPLGFLYLILKNNLKNRTNGPKQTSQPFGWQPKIFSTSVFILVILLALSPWFLWNVRHFGQIFYSYSGYYLLDQLGLIHTGIYENGISSRVDINVSVGQIAVRYFLLAAKSFYSLCREFIGVVGPFGLILAIAGLFQGLKTDKEKTIVGLLPPGLYLLAIIFWATYKYRFLVPLLPAFSILAALGFMWLVSKGKTWQWIAAISLAGTLVWFLLPFTKGPTTLYYGAESQAHDAQYADMKPLAISLGAHTPGVVLGYSQLLDGGIETVYWHGFPFVAGRGMDELAIKKLADDFNIGYIWVDTSTLPSINSWFPNAKLLEQSGEFAILELPKK